MQSNKTFKITTDEHSITIIKLDTDEYEFTSVHNYLEYYGKSYLKNLSFVMDFNGYLSVMQDKIKIEQVDTNYIMIELPIPFSDSFELMQLKKVDVDEFQSLKITIAKSSDELRKHISEVNTDLRKTIENQITINTDVDAKLRKIENELSMMKKELEVFQERPRSILGRFKGGLCIDNILNLSDEAIMVERIMDDMNKYLTGLTEQIVYDLKNKKNIKFNDFINHLDISNIEKFIEFLCAMGFKLINNSYINFSNSSDGDVFCIGYVLDKTIKAVKILNMQGYYKFHELNGADEIILMPKYCNQSGHLHTYMMYLAYYR